MNLIKISLIISVLILISMACSFNVDVPITTEIKTGETKEYKIDVPLFDDMDEPTQITLGFGAGELNLTNGSVDNLVSGKATYNVMDLEPEISISENEVKIVTGRLEIDGIPNFNQKVKNVLDLSLGNSPIDLEIKAGAYLGDFELGGLSLNNLHISDGAAEVEVNFHQPNIVEMDTLRYETGASNIILKNLSNANFGTMIFQSGAGDYELDFSGELQRAAKVFIETGLSNLKITVPETTNVELDIEGGLTNTTLRGNWIHSGNQYKNPADGPTIHIVLEMNAGNLILDHP